jgi:dihydroflavonol-4-reductase
MRIFITGATGLLGLTLIKELQKQKLGPIVAFTLPHDKFASLLPKDVEIIEGDILNEDSLTKAIKKDDIVIHLAAYISISGDKAIMEKINIGGTKNVVDVALKNGAKKLVYISTSHVLPFFKGKKIVESDYGKEGGNPIGYYETTKRAATDYVLSKTKEGLDASIVFPSGILSDEDPRLGEISTLLYKLKTRKLTFIVKGGYAFVDVHDVARGIIKAATIGKKGEGYTLSGGYLTIKDIDDIVVAHYPGLKKARIIPLWTAYLGLPFISIHERLSKKKPLYTVVSLKTIQTPADFDTSKAEKELGITFTPLKDTINRALDSIDKMQKDGLLK